MNFEKQISIKSITYDFVDVQRSGKSAIYKDSTNYVRIGEKEKIEKDLSFHKKMETLGFPVAKLIDEGTLGELYYFIEESLGDDCYGQIFKKETENLGHVSDESFTTFLDIMVKFTEAQAKTISTVKPWEEFKDGINLSIICEELPSEKDKILRRYNEIQERLNVFPFGILHGDMTPFNIYPKGVIDLEDSFQGPVGYDMGSLITLQTWFPDKSDDGYYKVYKFTSEQKSKFINTLDNIYTEAGLPKISDYLADFDFVRGIWFAVRIPHLPILQKFRYDVLKSLI